MRVVSRLVLIALVAWLLIGCRNAEPAPSLLELAGFAPAEAEVGDRLEVVGSGFPEGKPATLTFRGDLHRPGREPSSAVEIVVPATATSHNRISLILTEELQTRFCGRGDAADHSTFRGEIVAAFAPRKRGAPPVTGVLTNVVLDVLAPPLSPERAAERETEAKRALTFFGIELGDGQLTISKIVKGSRAERAGLLGGDLLAEVDGVTVRELGDVVPSASERFTKVRVRRGRLKEPVERLVDVQGFRATPPAELAVAAGLVGLLAAILLLGMLPLSRVLTWVERCTVVRIGNLAKERTSTRRWLAPLVFATELITRDPLPRGAFWALLRVVPPLLFLAVSAASTALAMGEHLVAPDLDLGVLVAASLTAQVTTGLMLGGWREQRRWSLFAGLKRALAVLGCQIPALAGIACVVMTTGTLRVHEIVEVQAAAPWRWHAFKNPILLLAFLLVMVSAVPEASRAAGAENPTTRTLSFFAEWGNVLVLSALCAALFLGGWRLPLLSIAEQRAGALPSMLGALLLQLKCWVLVLMVSWVRWLLPRVRHEQLTAVLLKWLLPLSMGALGLGAAWLAGLRSPVLRGLEALLGYVLFGLCTFVLAKLAVRIISGLRAAGSQGGVNPWI
jgi:NADH-quinone oxidoreductase subunit H